MKRLNSLAMIACVGAASLTSGVAQSSATALGTNCVERWPFNVGLVYSNNSVLSGSYVDATSVSCPIAVDHDLGSSAEFKLAVRDYDPDNDFACFAVAYNSDGVLQGTSPTKTTSGSSGSATTLTMSISGADPASSWAFAVVCDLPAYPSQLSSIRAY